MDDLRSDSPVETKEQDSFQRYEFAKRIAAMINSARSSRSLVIGIYGKWGEGKSSILNFTSAEIDDSAVQIKFNPWYFHDDSHLVKAFFESIAKSLKKRLSSKKDKVIKAFENYGDSIGGLSNFILPGSQTLVKAGQAIASNFKNESLEHYKSVVEKFIIAADCNFVIFIDDIDRLNIDEIQSVFKLVKLVGDFPRFSYVLAFDDELVASSLGHQFGGRTRKDGYDFLEKIIQVPLHLPKASTFALRRYTIHLVNETLDKLKIQLSKKESESFLSKFDSTFIPGLRNARIAVRFANSIAFSIPLLQGEVNMADLMIVDAIKAFYPELYQFIKQNPILFLSYYDLPANSGKDYKEGAKSALEHQINKYGNELGKKLLEMFWELFPQLGGLYNNVFPGKGIIDSWYKDQRICSMYYFDRYFSFSVREGDISDNYFQQLFEDVDKIGYRDFSKKLTTELKTLNFGDFIFKLRYFCDSFSMEAAENLCLSLANIGIIIPDYKGVYAFLPKEEMAKIIQRLISKTSRVKRLEFCLDSIDLSEPFNYSVFLYQAFSRKQRMVTEGEFLSAEEVEKTGDLMINKFEAYHKKKNAFLTLSELDLNSICTIYESLGRNGEMTSLMDLEFLSDPTFFRKVIRIFAPTVFSTASDEPLKGVFSAENYSLLSQFVDTNMLYLKSVKAIGKLTTDEERAFPLGTALTDTDLIYLFQLWHEAALKLNIVDDLAEDNS